MNTKGVRSFPQKHNTPAAQPEFELIRLPALNITSMSEEEDAETVFECVRPQSPSESVLERIYEAE
jgi:hypothetical protein